MPASFLWDDGNLALRRVAARWCYALDPATCWSPASAGRRGPHTTPPSCPGTSAAPAPRWPLPPWWRRDPQSDAAADRVQPLASSCAGAPWTRVRMPPLVPGRQRMSGEVVHVVIDRMNEAMIQSTVVMSGSMTVWGDIPYQSGGISSQGRQCRPSCGIYYTNTTGCSTPTNRETWRGSGCACAAPHGGQLSCACCAPALGRRAPRASGVTPTRGQPEVS
jgi:hypothetical protein